MAPWQRKQLCVAVSQFVFWQSDRDSDSLKQPDKQQTAHTSIVSTRLAGVWWNLLQILLIKVMETPWTSEQVITGPRRKTHNRWRWGDTSKNEEGINLNGTKTDSGWPTGKFNVFLHNASVQVMFFFFSLFGSRNNIPCLLHWADKCSVTERHWHNLPVPVLPPSNLPLVVQLLFH